MKDQTKYVSTVSFAILLITFVSFHASAALIPSDLEVTGNVSFGVDSVSASGNASQTATLESVLGGSSSITTVSGLTVTGANPLGGLMLNTNDGVGADASISGSAGGSAEGFFFDFLFSMTNTSLTDSFQIFFELVFTNTTSASGADAYADAEIILEDELNNELFFSDLTSDTFFGDEKNGSGLPTQGATLSDSGTVLFNFILAANSSNSFTTEIKLGAMDFDGSGSFSADTSAFIRLVGTENLTPPVNKVPTPPTLTVLMLVMMYFAVRQKNKG